MKKNKGIFILVSILFILLILAIGYICYDKFFASVNHKEIEISNNLREVNNNFILENLEKELIDYSNIYGLYYEHEININSNELFNLSLLKYSEMKNLNFTWFFIQTTDGKVKYEYKESEEKSASLEELASEEEKITGNELNSYMNNLYNTNKNFKANWDFWKCARGMDEFYYDKENDIYYSGKSTSSGYGERYIATKVVKAEEDSKNIYLYNKAIVCETGYEEKYSCYKTDYSSDDYEDVTKDAYTYNISDIEQEEKVLDESGKISIKKLANFALEEHYDSLYTYKHTFKKANNNYYYVSSEITK